MTTGTPSVGLLDIAPATERVPVRGNQTVDVSGISMAGLASIIRRFPVIGEMVSGGAPDLTVDKISKLVPDAMAVIIAVGCGYIDDPLAEAHAASLPADVQANLFGAIVRLTLPGGLGPFTETLTALARSFSVESVLTKESDTTKPQPSKS